MKPEERIADEARRLLNEPLLVEALDGVMADAFANFKEMKLSPDTLHEAIALQQRILVAHEFLDRLHAKITASGQMDGGIEVERKPTE